MKVIAIFFGFIAIVDVVAPKVFGLETNPITKIEKYLLARTNLQEPAINIQLAEEYYRTERTTVHLIRNTKRLLDALEKFINLRVLIDGNGTQYCNADGYNLIGALEEVMKGRDQSAVRLSVVINQIKRTHADNCRNQFYSLATDRLEPIKEISSRIHELLKPVVDSKLFYREQGEVFLSALVRLIIKANSIDLLGTKSIDNLNLECERRYPELDEEQRLGLCIIDPCETYISNLGPVFEMANQVSLKPILFNRSNELGLEARADARIFFEAWADYKLCKSVVHKTAKKQQKE